MVLCLRSFYSDRSNIIKSVGFFMNYFFGLLFLFFGSPIFAMSLDLETQTEASTHLSKGGSMDFCCERDKTDESAQEMSEQEAQQIAMNLLAPETYKPTRKTRPKRKRGSGQR